MASRRGRAGRPWRRARAHVLATQTHCALCGEFVDKRLRSPHPMAPHVDHRIPLAAGGAELDQRNLQLTHAKCNLSKGDAVPLRRASREW